MSIKWTDEAVLAEGRKYASRRAFCRGSSQAYRAAQQRNLLDQIHPLGRHYWSNDEDVLAEGRKYKSRGLFYANSGSAYMAALRRGLLGQLYPKQFRDWSNDEDVLAEGRKYRSRSEFQAMDGAAYAVARRRNLLDLIDFPESGANSDNDTIYIWRAVGQYFNGNPVYKIGVTSARLGIRRIKDVARSFGFEFDLICHHPVWYKATELERKVLALGEDPQFIGGRGASEFRAMSDTNLRVAISMICNQL